MIALLVTIDIQPEFKERFIEELLLDAKGANDDEPGCLRFDVIQDSEDPNRIHLYEVYKDDAAIAAHREAPHFVKWRDTTKDWLAKPYSRTLGTNVYPSDELALTGDSGSRVGTGGAPPLRLCTHSVIVPKKVRSLLLLFKASMSALRVLATSCKASEEWSGAAHTY